MSAKVLISGLANSGKTSLLKTLKDVFVVAIDGKRYPFPQPHINVLEFEGMDKFLSKIHNSIEKYNDKFGKYPDTVAIDSVSRLFMETSKNCTSIFKGFEAWNQLNKEISKFTDYIENTLLASGMNIVIISHATKDDDGDYKLVDQGSFSKAGGFLSIVDYASYVEVKAKKRTIHHTGTHTLARSLLEGIPDKEDVDKFNLQDYLDKLVEHKGTNDTWSLD